MPTEARINRERGMGDLSADAFVCVIFLQQWFIDKYSYIFIRLWMVAREARCLYPTIVASIMYVGGQA